MKFKLDIKDTKYIYHPLIDAVGLIDYKGGDIILHYKAGIVERIAINGICFTKNALPVFRRIHKLRTDFRDTFILYGKVREVGQKRKEKNLAPFEIREQFSNLEYKFLGVDVVQSLIPKPETVREMLNYISAIGLPAVPYINMESAEHASFLSKNDIVVKNELRRSGGRIVVEGTRRF